MRMRRSAWASIVVLSMVGVVAVSQVAAAWTWNTENAVGTNLSYFRQHAYSSPSEEVIKGGLTGNSTDSFTGSAYGCPNGCATKEDFIELIRWKYEGVAGRTKDAAQDHSGASFIISATLDQPLNGSSGHDPVTYADFYDWKSRIRVAGVTMEIVPVTFSIHTGGHEYGDGWDVQWFTLASKTTAKSIVFKKPDGTIWFQIELQCGNLADDTTPPPDASFWDASGRSTVSKDEVTPGETVTFKHYIENIGNKDVNGLAWETYQGSTRQATGTVNLDAGEEKKVKETAFTIPANAKVGDTYCQQVVFQDAEDNTDDESSDEACATVKSNYNLFPAVTNGVSGDIAPLFPGGTANMTGTIKNTALGADRDSPYEIGQFVIEVGQVKPDFAALFNNNENGTRYANASHVNQQSCSTWLRSRPGYGVVSDCAILKYDASTIFGANVTPLTMNDINADDYQPGDTICRYVSIGMYRYDITDAQAHRVSYPICVVVAKQPSVQVWGDDVHVGDNYLSAASGGESLLNDSASVMTSTSRAKRADGVVSTFGSWAEYGIFAPAPNGIIKSVSGGAISGTNGSEPDLTPASLANSLSFSNTEPGYFGKWTAPRTIDSIEKFVEQYPEGTANSSGTIHLDQLTANSGVCDGDIKRVMLTHSGNISIAGSMAVNATAILVTDQTVRITNDIVAPAANQTITGIGTAPQLIIIANNIVIDSGVKNVDAWLIARPSDPTETLNGLNGKISTCDSIKQSPDNYYDGLKLSTCNQPLRINGAVIAKEVQFRRTYGANKVDGLATPAEIVNLRADAFMWARPAANTGGGMPIKTMITTELPPRF